jgi:hypothetical protein
MELMKLEIDKVTCEKIAEKLKDLRLEVVSSPTLNLSCRAMIMKGEECYTS